MTGARSRAGFTLAEVVIAAAIGGVILAGMASAMLIAARAAPGRNGLADLTLRAGRATDQMSADVACATGFSILGAGSIEMQVPDRTGDGLADTVRYSWSGVSGDPLYRTFNGGGAAGGVAVATDVRQFSLSYVRTATTKPTSYSESAETQLMCTDNGALTYSSYYVSNTAGMGVWLLPTYPANAAYVRVTRADFLLKAASTTASAEVRMLLKGGGSTLASAATLMDFEKFYAPAFSSKWVEGTFDQNVKIAAGSGLTLALLNVNSGADDFQVGVRYGAAITNSALLYFSSSGAGQSSDSSSTVPCYIYGVYGTKNADASTYNLSQVICTMKCGDSSNTQLRCDWRTLNTPQVAGP